MMHKKDKAFLAVLRKRIPASQLLCKRLRNETCLLINWQNGTFQVRGIRGLQSILEKCQGVH